jgi:alkanesulfonate monooxygenase SsuD/methylene tetrahydromethanopterin reductase-like flavin-dependent oxidoreductase (luciferase family)
MDLALMLEGQNGLNWPRWQRIARLAEDVGLAGLYRSDHYTNANPPDKESLELWVSLTWLASHTSRLQFGPLVSRAKFSELSRRLDELLAVQGRASGELRRSLMLGTVSGRDQAELRRVLGDRDPEQLRAAGNIVGTAAECASQLADYALAGVQRVMLQWLAPDDVDRLEALGRALVPQFAA